MHAYLVLGSKEAGMPEIVADLIEGTEIEEQTLLLNPGEGYSYEDGQVCLKSELQDKENGIVFFMTDPEMNLADQVEAFKAFIDRKDLVLGRILSVLDCRLIERVKGDLEMYFDALFHFSDCILLTQRSGLKDSDIDAFLKMYDKKLQAPCLVEKVKKFRVGNPHLILYPEPRRLCHIFDDIDPLDEMEFDEENLPTEPFEIKRKADPYLERDDHGERLIKITMP